MWTREELKTRAKTCLKRYFWAAFVVSLIFGIVSGFGGDSSGTGAGAVASGIESGGASEAGDLESQISEMIPMPDDIGDVIGIFGNSPVAGSDAARIGRLILTVAAGTLIVIAIISIALNIFVIPVLEVGKNRFYMESRAMGASAGIGKLLWGFKNNYLNIVKTLFIRGLILAIPVIIYTAIVGVTVGLSVLGGPGKMVIAGVSAIVALLLLIPVLAVNIYLSYCWYLVPYILSENPEIGSMEALRLSKRMMNGHKFNTFVLGLSFIGWYLLGALLCGIGLLFVNPYCEATFAELYATLRQSSDTPLNGFGLPDPFNAGPWQGMAMSTDAAVDMYAAGPNPGGGAF